MAGLEPWKAAITKAGSGSGLRLTPKQMAYADAPTDRLGWSATPASLRQSLLECGAIGKATFAGASTDAIVRRRPDGSCSQHLQGWWASTSRAVTFTAVTPLLRRKDGRYERSGAWTISGHYWDWAPALDTKRYRYTGPIPQRPANGGGPSSPAPGTETDNPLELLPGPVLDELGSPPAGIITSSWLLADSLHATETVVAASHQGSRVVVVTCRRTAPDKTSLMTADWEVTTLRGTATPAPYHVTPNSVPAIGQRRSALEHVRGVLGTGS